MGVLRETGEKVAVKVRCVCIDSKSVLYIYFLGRLHARLCYRTILHPNDRFWHAAQCTQTQKLLWYVCAGAHCPAQYHVSGIFG